MTERCVSVYMGVFIKAYCSSEVRIATKSEKDAPLLQKYTSKLPLYNGGNCSLDKSKGKVSILSIKGVVITVERGNYRI